MEIFDAAGHLVRERVMNRTATFVFFIGESVRTIVEQSPPACTLTVQLIHDRRYGHG